jgi:hypothetical protein
LYFSRWDSAPAVGQIPEWIDDVRVEVVDVRPGGPM